jgi:hypothetical protein
MEIINKRGEINLNMWVEKAKDSHGFIRWGASVLEANLCIVQVYSPT